MATSTDQASAPDHLVLAGEFPPVTRANWVEQVGKVLLKGKDATPVDVEEAIRRRLVSTTDDGIAIQPLYTASDAASSPAEITSAAGAFPGVAPFVRGGRAAGGAWDVRQRVVAGPNASAAVITELERGATSILVDLTAVEAADIVGVLDATLTGVYLDLVAISLHAGANWSEAADALLALWARRNVAPSVASGVLGADPIGVFAASGGGTEVGDELADAAALASRIATDFPHVRTLVADGARLHDAGASDGDELAGAIAIGLEYVRALTDAGLDVDAAFGQVEFRLAATADQFATIAKLRAGRALWSRVAAVAGASASAGRQVQHAVTSAAMWTAYDPWVNLLRGTTACFAAGVGGADAITVAPFDELLDEGSSVLGRRLARNTQVLLVDESNVARVADPAGGSWYVERLTSELAAAAWTRFQAIERSGGFVAALESGEISARIAAARAARDRAVAYRQRPLTGLTEFPNIDEPVPPPPRTPPAARSAATRFAPIVAVRYAAAFEAQRRRADAAAERPTVFLATLGPAAAHTARATFAKNLFEVAGIRAVAAPDAALDTPDAVAAAFRASGASVACICSSDAVYVHSAASAAAALRSAGAARVYLAGKPAGHEQAWREAGVDEFVSVGCDVLDVVTRALDQLVGPQSATEVAQ